MDVTERCLQHNKIKVLVTNLTENKNQNFSIMKDVIRKCTVGYDLFKKYWYDVWDITGFLSLISLPFKPSQDGFQEIGYDTCACFSIVQRMLHESKWRKRVQVRGSNFSRFYLILIEVDA